MVKRLPSIIVAIFLSVLILLLNTNHSLAVINKMVNYQGKLMNSDGTLVSDGDYDFKLAIYDASAGGTCLWSAADTDFDPTTIDCPGDVPSGSISIALLRGLFAILLGDAAAGQNYIPDSVFNNYSSIYLAVTVESDSEMTPRKRIGAVPQAFNANNLIGDGKINITGLPSGVGVGNGTVYVNPGSASANETIFGAAIAGSQKLRLDAEGDLEMSGGLTFTGASPSISASTTNANLTIDANGTGEVRIAGTSTGNVLLAGGAAATGCTIYNATGNISCTGALQTTGATLTGLTPGSVIFAGAGGLLSQDNSSFYWNDTDNRLGIGTSIPQNRLDIAGNMAVGTYAGTATAPTNGLIVSGVVGIGTSSPDTNYQLIVGGKASILIDVQRADDWSNGLHVQKRGRTGDISGAVASGSEIGWHDFWAWDGTVFGRAAYVLVKATEDWTSTNHGAKYQIATTPQGGTSALVRFTINDNGNIGIGNENPTLARLQIYDDTSTASFAGLRIDQQGNAAGVSYGLYVNKDGTSTANIGGYFTAAGGTNNYALVTDQGSVGIGTTVPQQKLDVAGVVRIDNGVATPTTGGCFQFNGTNLQYSEDNCSTWTNVTGGSGWTDDGTVVRLTTSTDKVGIGTTAPVGKVQIKGDLYITGDILVDADGSATPYTGTHESTADGTLLVAVAATDQLCTDSLTAPTAVRIDLDNNCANNGGTDGTYILNTSATAAATAVTSAWGYKDSDSSTIYNDGEDLYIDNPPLGAYTGAHVGIGLTSTIAPLEVFDYDAPIFTRDITLEAGQQSAMSIGVTNNSLAAGTGPSYLFFASDSAGQKEYLGRLSAVWENSTSGAEAGGLIWSVRANTADVLARTEVFRATSSGRVGIGTSTPQSKTDIAGGLAIGSYAGVNVAPTNGLIVSGNAGIGTTSPQSKLDVSGGVAIGTYAGVNVAPSNGLIVSGSAGIGTTSPRNKLDISGALAVGTYAGVNVAPTNGAIIEGNVGIGTTSPQAKLDINGLAIGNGFMSRHHRFREDFAKDRADVTANMNTWGDTQAINFNEIGSITLSIIDDTNNGISRCTNDAAGDGCVLGLAGPTAGTTVNQIYNAANKPIGLFQARPSVIGANNDMYVGFSDAENNTLTSEPTNGAWFTNNDAGGATPWVGVIKSGVNRATVTCTGQNISTTQFALLRIDVLSTTQARFYVDPDISNGISMYECGTATLGAGTLTAQMTSTMAYKVNTGGTGASTFDVDFFEVSQDDPITSSLITDDGNNSPVDPITSADIAEAYLADKADSLTAGTVMSIDEGGGVKAKESYQTYQKNLLGVITTSPHMVMGDERDGTETVRIALTGRVPVKVNLENGPIMPGDYLTSSSVPGESMKATKAGPIIGKALEAYSEPKENIIEPELQNQILMFVSPSTYTGEFVGSKDVKNGQELLAKLLSRNLGLPEGLNRAVESELYAERIIAERELIASKITANQIFTRQISALPGQNLEMTIGENNKLSVKNHETGQELLALDAKGNLKISGTLEADKIKAKKIEGLELVIGNIDVLQAGYAQLTNRLDLMGEGLATGTPTPGGMVTGSSSQVLDLQVLGTLSNQGGLIVGGAAEFRNSVVFKAMVKYLGAATFAGDVNFEGRPTFNKDTGGRAVIKAGDESVEVTFEKEYAETPLINITATLPQPMDTASATMELFKQIESEMLNNNLHYIVTDASTKKFTVKMNKVASSDVVFVWQALAVKNPGYTSSGSPTPTPISEPSLTTEENKSGP